jgi:hypothetical protein
VEITGYPPAIQDVGLFENLHKGASVYRRIEVGIDDAMTSGLRLRVAVEFKRSALRRRSYAHFKAELLAGLSNSIRSSVDIGFVVIEKGRAVPGKLGHKTPHPTSMPPTRSKMPEATGQSIVVEPTRMFAAQMPYAHVDSNTRRAERVWGKCGGIGLPLLENTSRLPI